MMKGVSSAPRPTHEGGDALQHPEDPGQDVGGRDPGDQGEAPHVDQGVARAHDREHDHRRRGRREQADDHERRSPQGDAEPEPGRQPPGSHEECGRGGREDRPGAEGCVEHSDAGVAEPDELHRDDHREDGDGATHERLGADQGEEQTQVAMGVHRADPAQGAVQRAFGVALGAVERGRFRVDARHQPAGPRRRDRRHDEHLGRTAGSEQHRAQDRAGQGRRRVQGPADDVGTGQLRAVSHSDGSSAECTGRKSTAAADDTVTSAYTARAGPSTNTAHAGDGDGDGPDDGDGHEHLLPWPPVGVLGRQGSHDRPPGAPG